MARVDPIQTNFTAGEISPQLYARVDLSKYGNATQLLQNFVVHPHGGASRRNGTRFVAEVKDSSVAGRLIPFVFSTTQAYALEFGNLYIRFHTNGGLVTESSLSITGISQANPGVVTSAAHGLSDGDEGFISSVVGMTEVNTKRYKVAGATTNTFELNDIDGNNIDTSAFTAYSSGGVFNRIYEIASPYLTADLSNLKYTQSADLLLVAHPDYSPRELARLGAASWTLTEHDFQDGPYLALNKTATTITASAVSGSGVTLTSSAALFATTDVGRWIRRSGNSVWGAAKIVGFSSSTSVTIDIHADFPFGGTGTSADWRFGAWSDTTGWPEALSFHKQRLAWGGNRNSPQTVWLSRAGAIDDHSPTDPDGTVAADHGIVYTLLSNKVNAIRWLDSEKELNIGTSGGSFTLDSATSTDPLGPDSVDAFLQTTRRAHPRLPVFHVDQATLYASVNGHKIFEFVYSFEKDGKVAPQLSILAEHITGNGLIALGYAEEPDGVLWGCREDGLVVGMTYDRDNDVVAWHRHILGGILTGSDWPAAESIVVIPSNNEDHDEVWLIAERTINGATRRYVEYIGEPFEDPDLLEDSFFVDCGAVYDGVAATTISGLDYLEGETVGVLADGKIHPDKVVTNGAITLDYPALKVSVGYRYLSRLRSIDFEGGSRIGTAQTKLRRIHDVGILFHRTIGGSVGVLGEDLEPITFREGDDLMGDPPGLFSGAKLVNFPSSSDRVVEVYYETDEPTPATILGLVPRIKVSD